MKPSSSRQDRDLPGSRAADACLTARDDGITLAIRVQTKSSKSGLLGFTGECGQELKWGINAPPIEGRANKELTRRVAELFGVSKSHVEVVQGQRNRSKVVFIKGISLKQAAAVLAKAQRGY